MKLIVLNAAEEQRENLLKAGAGRVVMPLQNGSFTAAQEYPASSFNTSGTDILLNRFFFPSEQEELTELLHEAEELPAEDVYFADPAVISLASDKLKQKLVYHPDTLLTNSNDMSWWLARGIRSAVVSPLLTREETVSIIKACPACTVQIHGHTLMAESRRPLLSSYAPEKNLPGKRNLFLREEKRQERMPVYENEHGTLVYSDFELMSFREIRSFAEAGCTRFLINALFVPDDALADAVRAYRDILNGADALQAEKDCIEKYGYLPLGTGYYEEKTIK